MAALALDARVHAVALEVGVDVVIELRRTAGRLVALRAIVAERARVNVVVLVATDALLVADLELFSDVASVAVDDPVKAGQRELRVLVVVEDQRLEVFARRMTAVALIAELAFVEVFVTRQARGIEAGVF